MKVRFKPRIRAHAVLNERVAAYMRTADHVGARRRMVAKTVVILSWTVGSYALLLFAASTWWQVALAAVSLGLAMSGIGFSIMHDGNHGGYPGPAWVSRAAGFTLDMLGGSSYIWSFKHNVNHHTFTNIDRADSDIDLNGLARMSPVQAHKPGHRYQHIYTWGLYCLLAFRWILLSDFQNMASGLSGENPFPRPRGRELGLFVLGKVIALGLWSGMFFVQPWPLAVFGMLLTAVVLGFTLAIVFQLAHVVEKAKFPEVSGDPARCDKDWLTHQLETTADFAPRSKFWNWYLGGLNFQVEHHLFPKICHIHYPEIAKIFRQTCEEFDLPYNCYDTFLDAVVSHQRWLRKMGSGWSPSPAPSQTAHV